MTGPRLAAARQHLRRFGGVFPVGAMLATIGYEYSASPVFAAIAGICALAAIFIFAVSDKSAPVVFVAVGIGLVVWAYLTHADWMAGTWRAIASGSFVIALFSALSAIRIAAIRSEAIIGCGRFLAGQRPGLRYIALTVGGHLFGLILLYGSIALLGSLASEATSREADAELRRMRLRRMLVAINRGFASTLCWSPLGFSMAITTALVPGASWGSVVLPCVGNSLLMIGVGWGMDTAFKPRLGRPAPVAEVPAGGWLHHLRPLLTLLAIVVAAVVVMHLLAGVDVVGAVMSVVPVIAVVWVWFQGDPEGGSRMANLRAQIGNFIGRELPSFGGQIMLLFMAAFIGSLGAFLVVPLMARAGLGFDGVPAVAIVVAMVWVMPLTGQLGMNPILAASLILPLLPAPVEMGIHPVALVAAVTGGWALSGTTSPYTASVMLVGSFGQVPAREAGLRWNGPYVLVMGCVMSAWVAALALWM